jgi:PAS domain S-box-containing protein
MRLALETARLGTWRHQPAADRVHLDERLRSTFGRSDAAEVSLAEMLEWVHPDDRGEIADAIALALEVSRNEVSEMEFRVVRPDGRVRWVTSRARRLHGRGRSAGSSGDLLGTMLDITERKSVEQTREAFIGVLSHELRTPLTTIIGAADLLQRTRLDDEARESLVEDLASESTRLERLVDDLLVLSQTDHAQLVIEPQPVLVHRAIRAAIDLESGRYPDVRFEVDAPVTLPVAAAEEIYLQQVLGNLLSNAAKYGPDDDARVSIVARQEGDHIAIAVQDDGPGFVAEDGAKLFELFYRDPQGTRRRPGAGIGLYVVRSLVEAMGGEVWAKRQETGGAEVGFTVPILTD